MKWYFGINDNGIDYFKNMIKAAVNSCLLNTDLVPHCIYDGNGEHELIQWLIKKNVKIVKHRLTFYELMKEKSQSHKFENTFQFEIAAGAYLRTEIPLIEYDDFIFYTDVDVLFLKDVHLENEKPYFFSSCAEIAIIKGKPQFYKGSFNSGAMLMNLKNMRSEHSNFMNFLIEKQFDFNSYDQGALYEYYKEKWTILDEIYNWRPFAGINPEARVIHFHGPKPDAILDYLSTKSNYFFNSSYYELDITAYDYYLTEFKKYFK